MENIIKVEQLSLTELLLLIQYFNSQTYTYDKDELERRNTIYIELNKRLSTISRTEIPIIS